MVKTEVMSRLHFSANKCFKLAPWPSLTKPSAAVAGPPTSTVTMPPWCSRSYTPLLLPTPVQGPPPPHKTLSFPLKHQVFFFSISFLSLFARSNTFWEQRQRKVCESRVECNLFISWKTANVSLKMMESHDHSAGSKRRGVKLQVRGPLSVHN